MMKLVYNVDFFIDANAWIIEPRQFSLQSQTYVWLGGCCQDIKETIGKVAPCCLYMYSIYMKI